MPCLSVAAKLVCCVNCRMGLLTSFSPANLSLLLYRPGCLVIMAHKLSVTYLSPNYIVSAEEPLNKAAKNPPSVCKHIFFLLLFKALNWRQRGRLFNVVWCVAGLM